MNNTINLVISFVFIFIFCLFLRIELKHTLVIILISSVIIFIFQNIHDINIHYNNRFNNITNDEITNYIIPNRTNEIVNNRTNEIVNNINGYNGKKYKKTNNTELIPNKYYNNDDCTTDMSCIIKPDENNLGIKSDNNIFIESNEQ